MCNKWKQSCACFSRSDYHTKFAFFNCFMSENWKLSPNVDCPQIHANTCINKMHQTITNCTKNYFYSFIFIYEKFMAFSTFCRSQIVVDFVKWKWIALFISFCFSFHTCADDSHELPQWFVVKIESTIRMRARIRFIFFKFLFNFFLIPRFAITWMCFHFTFGRIHRQTSDIDLSYFRRSTREMLSPAARLTST